MTADSDPTVIQTDLPFNVEAVPNKAGRIDALAKRPRLSQADLAPSQDDAPGPLDPSRFISDTRALIPTDTDSASAAPDAPHLAPSPRDVLDMTGDVPDARALDDLGERATREQAEPAQALTDAHPDAGTDPATNPQAEGPVEATAEETGEATDDPSALSELQQRMLDIKSSNQSLTRELEALEESLRQSPPSP